MGAGEEIRIKDLAFLVKAIVGFETGSANITKNDGGPIGSFLI